MKSVKFGGFWGAGLGVGIAGAAVYGLLMYPQTETGQSPAGQFYTLADFDSKSSDGRPSQPGPPGSFLQNSAQDPVKIAKLAKPRLELPQADRVTAADIQLAPELRNDGLAEDNLSLPFGGKIAAGKSVTTDADFLRLEGESEFDSAFKRDLASEADSVDDELAALAELEFWGDVVPDLETDAVPMEESNLRLANLPEHISNATKGQPTFEVVGTGWRQNPYIDSGQVENDEVNGALAPVIEIEAGRKGNVVTPRENGYQETSVLDFGIESPIDPTNRFKSKSFDGSSGLESDDQIERPQTSWVNVDAGTTPAASSLGARDPYSIAPIDLGVSEAVAQQAVQHIEYGKTLARRGASFAARQEFYSALRVLAQANDGKTGVNEFSLALRKGILALKESEDFLVRDTETQIGLDVSLASETHRTNILTDHEAKLITPNEAIQRYHVVAQEQLQMAGGRNVVSAEALYCLGKLHSVEAQSVPTSGRMDSAKAMVYHRAALASDQNNFRAANELGVLMARAGQLNEARDMFKKSLIVNSAPQAWENLSKVHERMNEPQMAQLAQAEFHRSIQMNAGRDIQWKLPNQFNAEAPIDFHEAIAAKPVVEAQPAKNQSVDQTPESDEQTKSFGQKLKDLF